MVNRLTRYNQGFGGFGPLEQCNSGKLVKYTDVMSVVDANVSLTKQRDDLLEACRDERIITDRYRDMWLEEMQHAKDLSSQLATAEWGLVVALSCLFLTIAWNTL